MSSPLAKSRKSAVDHALITAHQRLSHGRRIGILATELASRITQLVKAEPGQAIRILDVGCGDMTLADAIQQRLGPVALRCVDVHICPPERAAQDPRWQRYSTFDGRHLDFAPDSFDVVMMSDVLHHVQPDDRPLLLKSAGRVGRHVLVKDHLEHGWFSRQMLRAMDVVGNYGYGVPIPRRYFDRASLESLFTQAGLGMDRMDVGVNLYSHLPVLRSLLSPDWQVIAVASRRPA